MRAPGPDGRDARLLHALDADVGIFTAGGRVGASWPVLWPAMAIDRNPQAKAHEGGREAQDDKRNAEAREGRQPEVAVDSPKEDTTTSQHDGQRNRTPHRTGSVRLLSLPSLSLLGTAARAQVGATRSC